MNGICHTLCISVLPEHKGELWLLAVKLTTSLLQSLGHQFLSHALDFVGVHQERLAAVSTHTHATQTLTPTHTHTHTHTHTELGSISDH